MLNELTARLKALLDDVVLSAKEFVQGLGLCLKGTARAALALPKSLLMAARDAVRKMLGGE